MIIATIDRRQPVTIALDFAFKTERITPDREKELRKELKELVVESAKKFVGFQNTESLRKASDITLGILSLAVVHSTKGKRNPEQWAEFVLEQGLKEMARGVIKLVKLIAETPETPAIDPSENSLFSARELLLIFATNKNGYAEMRSRLYVQKNSVQVSELARWLIRSISEQSIPEWLDVNRQEIDSYDGNRKVTPEAEEVINNLLFRHCAGLSVNGNCILRAKDFRSVYADYKSDKAAWKLKAKKRYNEILERIPEDLRTALVYAKMDWFERFLSKGPPAVPKSNVLDTVEGLFQGYHTDIFG